MAIFWNRRDQPDLTTSKLAALHFYRFVIPAPAALGKTLFEGSHVLPLVTEPGWSMHAASEIGIDDFRLVARPIRSSTGRHR
jgi:hypothetical protein